MASFRPGDTWRSPPPARLVPLSGSTREAAEGIVSALTLLATRVDVAYPFGPQVDLVAATQPETAPLAQAVRVLASATLKRALGGDLDFGSARELAAARSAVAAEQQVVRAQPDPAEVPLDITLGSDYAQTADSIVGELMRALGEPGGGGIPGWEGNERQSELISELAALGDIEGHAWTAADLLVRELGLEEHGLLVALVRREDASPAFECSELTEEAARAALLERLFDRLEAMALDEPLFSYEREASRWWFDRWTLGLDEDEHKFAFTGTIREQEYSFVERAALAFRAPAVLALADGRLAAAVPPRQRELAAALGKSFADIFVVDPGRGGTALFRSVRDGRRYDVREHANPAPYARGMIGFGRLSPIDGKSYLRSPGMLFVTAQPGDEQSIASVLGHSDGAHASGIEVEASISRMRGVERLPRQARAAATRADAASTLEDFESAMREAGLLHATAPDELDLTVQRAIETEQAGLGTPLLDECLLRWVEALGRQARRPRGSSKKSRSKKRS